MANAYEAFTDKLLAQAVLVAQGNTIPLHYLNRAIEQEAGKRGSQIHVPITSEAIVRQVQPANVPPITPDTQESDYIVTLDNWEESVWYLTDKEASEVMAGHTPARHRASVTALVERICEDVYSVYKEVYSQAGTPGTIPFSSDLTEGGMVGDLLTAEKAPTSVRWMGLSLGATSKAKILPEFASADRAGTPITIQQGEIGYKLGVNWLPDQQTPRHTTAAQGGTYTVNSAAAVGDSAVDIDASGGALTLVKGDLINFAGDNNALGDPQQYVVMQDITIGAGSNALVSIRPNVRVAKAGSEVVTVEGAGTSYEVSLGGHESGIAFASKMSEDFNLDEIVSLGGTSSDSGQVRGDRNYADPVTGLVLRVRVVKEHFQTSVSVSCLWGKGVPDGRLLVRLAGA